MPGSKRAPSAQHREPPAAPFGNELCMAFWQPCLLGLAFSKLPPSLYPVRGTGSLGGRQHSLSLLQGLNWLVVADASVPGCPFHRLENQSLGSAQEHNADHNNSSSINNNNVMVPAGLY